MKLQSNSPREFIFNLRDTLSGTLSDRTRMCAYWDSQYFCGAPPDVEYPAIVNVVAPPIDTRAGNLFSPDNLSFRLEYDIDAEDPTLLMAQRAASYLSRHIRDSDVDIEFSDAVKLALRHGSAFFQLGWDDEALTADTIPMSCLGVSDEKAKGLHEQDAILVRYTASADGVREWLAKVRSDIVIPGMPGEPGTASPISETDRVILGLNQPIGGNSSVQAGFVNLMPPRPVKPSEKSILRQVEIDALWIWDTERQNYASVFVIEGRDCVGTDRWRNFFGIKGFHPYTYVCPDPVKGYLFGRSAIADLQEPQTFTRKRVQDYDKILEMRARPAHIGFGATQRGEIYQQALDRPGGWITETGPMAKVTAYAPEMPQELPGSIAAGMEWAREHAGQPPVVQGRGETGVRAQVHAESLTLAASARERNPALRVQRQCGDMGHLAFEILKAKCADQITDGSGGSFLLSSLPSGYHIAANGFSASPLFAAEHRLIATELLKAGAIGAEEFLDMLNVQDADRYRHALKKREAAQAKLMQEHPELITTLGKAKGGGGRKH